MMTATGGKRGRKPKWNPVLDTLQFMQEVVITNRSTGAIAPSGKALAERVTDIARVSESKVIVEYGPGTGVFTEIIFRKKRKDAHFIAMEVNPRFVEATRLRCPKVPVFCDSAENTRSRLKEAGFDGCDTIVSGLPWTRFDDELQDRILDATYEVLWPGGRFVTFAYALSPFVPSGKKFFEEKLRAKFPRVTRSKNIWNNFPPCVVYVAEKD